MPNESFTTIYRDLLEEIAALCGKGNVQDKFPAYFMRRMEKVMRSLVALVNGGEAGFEHDELPFVLYAAWLVNRLKTRVKNKKKSKKAVSGRILYAIRAAHQAQHLAWDDIEWPGMPANAHTLSDELICAICAREYREAALKAANQLEGQDKILQLYSVCIEFFRGKTSFNFSMAVPENSQPDLYAPYVTEWPRRSCPRCGRQSYPVIAREKGFDAESGFILMCQFCGAAYGKGGRKKSLHKEGRRVISTVWTTDRFEIHACQFCGQPDESHSPGGAKLVSHHIVPISEGGPDIPSNIMILCPECHAEAHRRRDERKNGI